MKIKNMRTCHLVNPLGYRFEPPILSWTTEDTLAKRQESARIQVERQGDDGAWEQCFDSGPKAEISCLGYVPDVPLQPYTRYRWTVKVQADNGDTAMSEPVFFETAKMDDAWQAKWIRADLDKNTHPLLKTSLTLDAPVAWARVYACGLGIYELELNGQKLGDEVLLPGYHSYDYMLQYQTFDITDRLNMGPNTLGAALGPGWYKGRFMFEGGFENLYDDTMALICELHIRLTDGRELVFGTDETWLGKAGPVQFSNIYDGEIYNAQQDTPGWSSNNDVSDKWKPAIAIDGRTDLLTARNNPPITRHEHFQPATVIHNDIGETILDFGLNMTGWVEFEARSLPAGTTVKLFYSEVMQHGRFYRDNLRTAKAEYIYTSNGSDAHVCPRFTYYGFRYVKVEGLAEVRPEDFTAYAIYSDIPQSGWLKTRHSGVNQLFRNALWGQKDNFLDIPTDCPQRDERMGWTGDVAIFCETAGQNMYTPAFFHYYMENVWKEQKALGGSVPLFVPRPKPERLHADTGVFQRKNDGYSVWGDVATILPWTLYTQYGDINMLRSHYPSMKGWTDWVMAQDAKDGNKNLWLTGPHLGDWLALDTDDDQDPMGGTDIYFIASAFYHQSADLTAKAAEVLELTEDAKKYSAKAEAIRHAFLEKYFDADGQLATKETQTAAVVCLKFGLYPGGSETHLVDILARKIQEKGNHLDTGFVGTPYLCPVLSEHGRHELACSLLLQETYPSWLFEVNLGATTVWERWNSLMPDGSVSGTGMNSLNHYAYGSIVNWMYKYLGGLWPLTPGYTSAFIQPMPDKRIGNLELYEDTAAGRYEVFWEYLSTGKVRVQVKIPFNCTAAVKIPGATTVNVNAGEYEWTV